MSHATWRYKPLLVCLCLVIALILAWSPAPASAAKPGLLLILDCSGSMWGRVDNQPKISIAKSVLLELVSQVPEQVELGLMAYGHRRKGDCADIEMLNPLGAGKSDLQKVINGLSPKGKTPLSGSLQMAGEQLAARESETTLVLVSDGLETCQGDPCKTVEALKQKGIKLVVHVVGFDVGSTDASQLKCIAQAGGGRYFAAANLKELKDALGQVKDAVVQQKPLPAPPPPPPAVQAGTSKSTSQRVRIKGPGTVKLKPASWVKMPPRFWALVDVESGQEKGRSNTDQMKIKAGEYQLLWRQSKHDHRPAVQLTEIVSVASGKTVEVPLDTGIRPVLPKGFKAPYWWGLTEPGKNKLIWGANQLGPQVVPAGAYDIYWHQEQHGSRPITLGTVNLQSGKLNDVLLDHGLTLQPADWVAKEFYYYAIKDERNRVKASWRPLIPQLAPAGTYTLVLNPIQHGNNEIIWGEVTIPEHGFAKVPINSGIKFIHKPQAKPPYRFYLINLDTKKQIHALENWGPIPAPPGRYRLDWWETQHGSKRQTLAEEIEIKPGVLLEVEM